MSNEPLDIEDIDIDTFKGVIPPFTDLVVYEKSDPEKCMILLGFDEVGVLDTGYKEPMYGFLYFGL